MQTSNKSAMPMSRSGATVATIIRRASQRLALAGFTCLFVFMLSFAPVKQANAQWAVIDAAANALLAQILAQLTTQTATLEQINATLSFYTEYMMGANTTGSGIIELTAANGNQLAKINAFNRQYFANLKVSNLETMAQALQMERTMKSEAAAAALSDGNYSNLACGMVSSANGASGANQSSIAQEMINEKYLTSKITSNRLRTSVMVDMLMNRHYFCNKRDVENGRPGCSSVGELPNADIQVSSLSRAAVDMSGKGPVPKTNLTVGGEGEGEELQKIAALSYIGNIMPFQPKQPKGTAQDTPDGRKAYVMYRRYISRSSAVSEALNSILAFHTVMAKAPESWSKNEEEYKDIFPNQKFPDIPSEAEIINFKVFQAYAGEKKRAKWATADSVALQREQLRMMALSARLRWLSIQRQAQTNQLLAALLSQSLNGVTYKSIARSVPATSASD